MSRRFAIWMRNGRGQRRAKMQRNLPLCYSETGSVMPFNAPIATGKTKVQEVWTQLMARPGFSLHFTPTQIEVAKSKDMAYDVGTFELKLNDAQGAPMTIPGKYVVVWKKQKGGSWKAEADIFNTDK